MSQAGLLHHDATGMEPAVSLTLREVQALDREYYLQTFGERTPVAFTHGADCALYGLDGKAYLDFLGGIAVTALGHNHPAVTAAITRQAARLIHCSNLYYIPAQAELARLLVTNSALDRVFFCNSGAEANEAAFKLARKYFRARDEERYEIITAANSFHGRTLATLAATGQTKYQEPFRPLTPGFLHAAYNDLPAIEAAITPRTCAVLLETIQGEGGVIEADARYLQGVEALCRKHGLLLILDEVQTGMGRTGKLFSYEHFDLRPDIVTLAKALGNGMPVGAALCTQRVADALAPGDHGSTFGGNPLACAAALAVVRTMLETPLLAQAATTGDLFKRELLQLAMRHPRQASAVRGRGLLLGLQLTQRAEGKEVVRRALERGFLINCAGHNTLRFAPPLTVSPAHIAALTKALGEIFTEMEG